LPCFLDTNVLLYAGSKALKQLEKQVVSTQLLQRRDVTVSIQVLQEFYAQATRVSREDPLSHPDAPDLVTSWMRFNVQPMTLAILNRALDIREAAGFSYWDSAIIAEAQAAGCDVLYTEDLSHGQVVDGVTIVNPFRDLTPG
jgi:predicted nucleic acid-binding protein